jgi:hypothetical protein
MWHICILFPYFCLTYLHLLTCEEPIKPEWLLCVAPGLIVKDFTYCLQWIDLFGAQNKQGLFRYTALIVQFLGAFAKLRKAIINCVISVHLSVHSSVWNNSAPTGLIFMKFDIWGFFENLSRKFKFHSNLIRIKVTSHENQCTFFINIALISS